MSLIFEQIRTGGDRNFGYLLGDRNAQQAILIDPSYSPDLLVQRARDQKLTVTHIINTHGHADHTNGNASATRQTEAPIVGHPDLPEQPDQPISNDEELTVGALHLRCLYTPGHSADHLVLYEPTYQLLITGDLLFVGKVGGTSNDSAARTEWDSLQHVVDRVDKAATVWPGHDYGVRPSSTLELECQTNPFLQCQDVEAFLSLKSNWTTFKTTYGLK